MNCKKKDSLAVKTKRKFRKQRKLNPKDAPKRYKVIYFNKIHAPRLSKNNIRMLDFIFPFENPEELRTNTNPDSVEFVQLHQILGLIDSIKRITFMGKFPESQKPNLYYYVMKVSERWPSNQIWKGIENLSKIEDY